LRWRRLFRVLHRDIGYLLFGLVLAYCISGLAVNHIDDWNPSYGISVQEVDVGPLPVAGGLDAMQRHVVEALDIDPDDVTGRRRPGENAFVVFAGESKAQVAIDSGRGTYNQTLPRTGLLEMNALHLNKLKGAWTIVADVFAVLLAFLAISGIVLLKGRTGFMGRGKWFVLAGLVVPIVALIWYAEKL
jgi:hypothetical protein